MKRILSLLLTAMLALSLCACEATPGNDTNTNRSTVVSASEVPFVEPAEGGGERELTAHFIDVEQGDCTLLQSDGHFMLIDAGESIYGRRVVSYLHDAGCTELEYVIATHPHTDHIGGLSKVLREFPCEHFITPETDQSSNTWMKVLRLVDEKEIDYIDPVPGDTYTFGSSSFTILAPNSDDYDGYNNYSVVTRFVCGDVSFLLTGDAEKQSEKEMLNAGYELKSDLLKVGHHGSYTSSTAGFLREVSPTYAVISCGIDNDYGHPHKETLQKLGLLNTTVYRTDRDGTVVASTDGKDIRITTAYSVEYPTETYGAKAVSDTYVGNKNSKKFHYPSCDGAKSMNEENKVTFNSRDEAIDAGYEPCGKCDP